MVPCIYVVKTLVLVSAFLERQTMPKLIIAASSDQFFLPDDTHYFWDALLEPKEYL